MPSVGEAVRQAEPLLQRYVSEYRFGWGFAPGAFPAGLRVLLTIPEWRVEVTRTFAFGDILDQHQLAGALLGVWDEVLRQRIAGIYASKGFVVGVP